jgi:hypothetical protein
MINSAAKSRAINGGERLSGSGEKHSDTALAADSFPSTRLWCAGRLLILVAAAALLLIGVCLFTALLIGAAVIIL